MAQNLKSTHEAGLRARVLRDAICPRVEAAAAPRLSVAVALSRSPTAQGPVRLRSLGGSTRKIRAWTHQRDFADLLAVSDHLGREQSSSPASCGSSDVHRGAAFLMQAGAEVRRKSARVAWCCHGQPLS